MTKYTTPFFIAAILLGILAGFALSHLKGSALSATTGPNAPLINTATEVGSTDTKTFRDSAQGLLETGGLGGEGTHHLTRPGGSSQTAYLVSSIVDLDNFVGKQVEVFGETIKAQKVGWLMDVGRIKILP